MTREEQVEILARELFVLVRGGYGRIPDSAFRDGWSERLAEESRAAWRERAERLVAALDEARIELVAPS